LLGVKSTINPVIYFRTFETPVDRSQEIESLVNDGAGRLLARASDSRSLTVDALASRIRAAVDKYLLRDDPATPSAEIKKFMDEMQADDLCLIIACERGNENAWADLVARFTTTVRSAARSASANEDAAEDLAQSIWAELHGLRITPAAVHSLVGCAQWSRNFPLTPFASSRSLCRRKKKRISNDWHATRTSPTRNRLRRRVFRIPSSRFRTDLRKTNCNKR
jgi:hypothetical protein